MWWGYDDKLYEYGKSELTRLAGLNKPFYFILQNADTHFPDGLVSEKMTQKPFEKQYATVIFSSQGEVVKFVQWVKTQPWSDNATVLSATATSAASRHETGAARAEPGPRLCFACRYLA